MGWHAYQNELSIDDFIADGEACRVGSLIADPKSNAPEEELYLTELTSLVRGVVVRLGERERHIVCNRYGLFGGKEQSFEEIGKDLNLSRERVRQLEREARGKIRARLIHRRGLPSSFV